MKILCIACSTTFEVPFSAVKNHSKLCPGCECIQTMEDATKQITSLQAQKESIFPGIKSLRQQKLSAELKATKLKNKYENLVALYERLDREQAKLKLACDLASGAKSRNPYKRRKTSKKTSKAAKAHALTALNNLDPATRAIVLAQLNKEQTS